MRTELAPQDRTFTPVLYERMVTAIAECHRVDEVKELRDKAAALQVYAKQAKNVEAEHRAYEIRARAERRCGELFREMQRDQGKRTDLADTSGQNGRKSEYRDALKTTGIDERQARRFQQLADVPKETFEAAMRDPSNKSARRIVEDARDGGAREAVETMDRNSLHLWGRVLDFERYDLFRHAPRELLDGMTDTMRDDMRRIVPRVLEYLGRLKDAMR